MIPPKVRFFYRIPQFILNVLQFFTLHGTVEDEIVAVAVIEQYLVVVERHTVRAYVYVLFSTFHAAGVHPRR